MPATNSTNCSARSSGSGASIDPRASWRRSKRCDQLQTGPAELADSAGDIGKTCGLRDGNAAQLHHGGVERPAQRRSCDGMKGSLEVVEGRGWRLSRGPVGSTDSPDQNGLEQGLFAREPGIERCLRCAGGLGDGLHRCALIASLEEQTQRVLSDVVIQTGRLVEGRPSLASGGASGREWHRERTPELSWQN